MINMNYVYTALGSFVAGAVLCRLYYSKVIGLGKELLGKAENDAELAWRYLSSLPAKIKAVF